MIKIPRSGHSYPFAPKIEKTLIPPGYIELDEAVNLLGKAMFPDAWTGDERGFFCTGVWGQEFRSKIEYETDMAFRDAVLMAQCKLECELSGGDPKQRYCLQTRPQKDDEPFMPMGDLPELSNEEMLDIEHLFADEIEQAEAVRKRRENVEDRFLREMLWPATVIAHYIAGDGRIMGIEPHTWGSPSGKQDFERGWLELSTEDGNMTVRPILIRSEELDAVSDLSSADPNRQYKTPYQRFMDQAAQELGLTADRAVPKNHIVEWLKANWPANLGKTSERDIEKMATFLRDPSDRKGGHFTPDRNS